MDNKLGTFLTDEKNPKPLRYLTLAGLICFVEWVLISIGMITPFLLGKIFFFLLAVLMLAVAIRLFVKLHRS